MIRVQNLYKSFNGVPVLKGLDLEVREGTTRVILGSSGSGKSVLMKHLIGLLQPDSGQVLVDGEDITQFNRKELLQLRMKFGMVFQQAALFDSMNVFDNVAFPLVEHTKLSKSEMSDKVFEKLKMFGLENHSTKFPSEISGGMRKRAGLCRAVILDPRIVLYDEPTTGLDPLSTEAVDAMINDASERLQVTSVVISHDIGSALNIADDIAVIHLGNIVEDCPRDDLQKSDDPFVKEFLRTWFSKQ